VGELQASAVYPYKRSFLLPGLQEIKPLKDDTWERANLNYLPLTPELKISWPYS
jgi:hypothetical protein